MIREIKNNDMSEAMKADAAVVDFGATWCGPCRMLRPVLEEISGEMAGKAEFYSCDVDENDRLAAQYGIMSVPTVMFFKKGEKTSVNVGFRPKADWIGWIEKNL